MKTIDLGTCCTDCFNAINSSLSELPPESRERAAAAGGKLSRMAELEQVVSMHTGEDMGFSAYGCLCCGSNTGGQRYKLYGIQYRRDIA